jgi:hypothetical protein
MNLASEKRLLLSSEDILPGIKYGLVPKGNLKGGYLKILILLERFDEV